MKRYKREELLKLLAMKYRELGRQPTKNEINRDVNMPASTTYSSHFGGVTNAVKELGLSPGRFTNLDVSIFVELAREFYLKNGKAPSMSDFDDNPNYPHTTFLRDSKEDKYTWNEILSMADIPLFSRGPNWEKNRRAELIVKHLLLESGHKVEDLSEKSMMADHAFLVDGETTVDVRFSAPVGSKRFPAKYWKFKLHLGTKRVIPKYFICVGFDESGDAQKIFVVPSAELTVTESISININRIDNSKYSTYLLKTESLKL